MDPNFVPEKAVKLAEAANYAEALEIFRKNLQSSLSPQALSYYGLSLAVEEEDYERAVSMCLSAAGKEFYSPEIYLNLGKTLLLSGRKMKAMKVFRKGLRFDETNVPLMMEIKKLGQRRQPAISFLSRGNLLNKVCGLLTYKASGRGFARYSG